MLRKITGVITFTIVCIHAFAQGEETLMPIPNNPVLQQAARHPLPPSFVKKAGALLPFFDDFSKGEVFPDPNKWTDKLAFINTGFPVAPPSIGVATLDGLDSTGRPYFNINAAAFGGADTLTSQPIDISAYAPGNNIHLSFFYQPQGLSFGAPKKQDSLALQFRNNAGKWRTVWSVLGSGVKPFKPVIIKIDSLDNFYTDFQFRFINYMNYLGGTSQWHIDYVYMERNRTTADTLFNDVAVAQCPMSFLRDYQEMPYSQFKGFENNEIRDSAWGVLSNLGSVGRTVDLFHRYVTDDTGNVIINSPRTGLAIGASSSATYGFRQIANTPPRNSDTVKYTVAEYLKITGANFRLDNDSVTRTLTFGNHFAYDDGTAEAAYGFKSGFGKIAYKFRVNRPDSLRAISVYFFQVGDTIKKGFTLNVWENIFPGTQNDKLLYSKFYQYPTYTDSINGFHTYILDSALSVSSEFYIGWVQTSEFQLNIGWDRNYGFGQDSVNPNLLFYSNGKWFQSQITTPGTLMMRPHVGRDFLPPPVLHAEKPVKENQVLTVYPNPATSVLHMQMPDDAGCTYTLSDLSGKTVMQGHIEDNSQNTLSINFLPNGLYFIILHHPEKGNYYTKFIKN